MKKKFLSICITLILFCSTLVPVFATELVTDTQVPFWLLDIRNQCYLSNNAADVTFGLATYGNDASHYLVKIVGGGALYLTYEVPAGETVYFRWAIARNNMGNGGKSTFVRMSVDGSQKVNKTYNYSNLGDYGTYGSIVIEEDYTNTSNSKQLVTYVIENNGLNPYYEYVPILVGTNVLIDKGSSNFGDFDFTVDMTGVEDKLSEIIELLQQRPNDINFEVPFELWQLYSFFIDSYHYVYDSSSNRVPWLIRTEDLPGIYYDDLSIRGFGSDTVYFSLLTDNKDFAIPRLVKNDGSSIAGEVFYHSSRSMDYGNIYTIVFTNVDPNGYYYLRLPYYPFYQKIIPLYFGIGDNVPDSLTHYINLPSENLKNTNTIIDKLSNIIDIFSGNSTTSNNANISNENLSNTVTEFDNIEKNQVENMQQSLNNLPTLDFNAFNDFAPTVQFVSSTMQQIYDSNQYLQLLINACLLIGIALLLIGRGNRR